MALTDGPEDAQGFETDEQHAQAVHRGAGVLEFAERGESYHARHHKPT